MWSRIANPRYRVFCFINNKTHHFLYIIYSKSTTKYYEVETHDVKERISKHNQHLYTNSFTKIANDWNLVLCFECINRDNALYLERFIKRMKSKVFIEKIIQKPDILIDVLPKK